MMVILCLIPIWSLLQLGIFVHLFIKKDVFYEMGDLAEELVESSEGIYLLQDGSLLKRAKEFVSENLIKHKD